MIVPHLSSLVFAGLYQSLMGDAVLYPYFDDLAGSLAAVHVPEYPALEHVPASSVARSYNLDVTTGGELIQAAAHRRLIHSNRISNRTQPSSNGVLPVAGPSCQFNEDDERGA